MTTKTQLKPLGFHGHCQREHDRIVFTDGAAFETHMRTVHGSRAASYRRPQRARKWVAPKQDPAADAERLAKWADAPMSDFGSWYSLPSGPALTITTDGGDDSR